ncbi:MAG: putative metal-dependent hydrolase YcfH [Chlamydiae bacterium]|nr:putative metal-dependent hydrolase YcfH [Chlamydiota bacterium]
MFIDSHAHLTSDSLFEDADEILKRAKKFNVFKIVNICTDLKTLERGIELSKKYPWIYNAGSTTPHDVTKEGELYFSHFRDAAKKGLLVAVGETGLDYYYEHSPKELQKELFIRYIELAVECNLPLIIHCRDAFDDFFDIIDKHYPKKQAGVLHCFTGTLEDAQKLIERKWFISFSGIITFKRSQELRQVAKWVPLENLLIETDSPYLAPQSKRGKVNEPAFISETAEMIAKVKELSLNEVVEHASRNTQKLFKLYK